MRTVLTLAGATLCGFLTVGATSLAVSAAYAGGFGVREQSAYFLGSAFAGSAAGTDISSMFWNSAATAARPGCNLSSNFTAIFGEAKESAVAGSLVTGVPPIAPGLKPTSQDVGTSSIVPASYATCQVSERLYVGLGMNAPFGFLTKPDNPGWAGSPIAITSKIFSFDINPTLAYKLTPELTIAVGAQIEFLSIRLNHGAFPSVLGNLSPSRAYDADDWSAGATAGVLWQPSRGTSIGLGYRSAVGVDVSGDYTRSGFASTATLPPTPIPGVSTTAKANLTLPEEVTLSARQYVTPQLALLGTVEWQNWSRIQNVTAMGATCGPNGVCEVLNLNYRDGWLYSVGVEYAYSRLLMLRAGIGYETSPIQDSTRDILLPDSNRILLAVGASYKISDQISADIGYSHLFFEDGPFCIANPTANGGSTHCNGATPAAAVLLNGKADVSADILAFGLKYKF